MKLSEINLLHHYYREDDELYYRYGALCNTRLEYKASKLPITITQKNQIIGYFSYQEIEEEYDRQLQNLGAETERAPSWETRARKKIHKAADLTEQLENLKHQLSNFY